MPAMNTAAGTKAAEVGHRIRTFREKQELTLADLSERTGLDTDFLASVEENSVSPSLGPLIKIARALAVRLGTFLDDQVSKDPLIVRLGERTEQIETHNGESASASLRFHSLGRGKTDRRMEPFFIRLEPESSTTEPALSSHEGEEFMVVTDGQVAVVHGQDKHLLDKGDSIYFNSIVPHHVSCASDEAAEIYAVVYIPE